MEMNLRVNLLGPGPLLMKKGFTGPRSHKGWETLDYGIRTGSPTARLSHDLKAWLHALYGIFVRWLYVFKIDTFCIKFLIICEGKVYYSCVGVGEHLSEDKSCDRAGHECFSLVADGLTPSTVYSCLTPSTMYYCLTPSSVYHRFTPSTAYGIAWHPALCTITWHPSQSTVAWHPALCTIAWHPALHIALLDTQLCVPFTRHTALHVPFTDALKHPYIVRRTVSVRLLSGSCCCFGKLPGNYESSNPSLDGTTDYSHP